MQAAYIERDAASKITQQAKDAKEKEDREVRLAVSSEIKLMNKTDKAVAKA
jgi:hypothetical protein